MIDENVKLKKKNKDLKEQLQNLQTLFDDTRTLLESTIGQNKQNHAQEVERLQKDHAEKIALEVSNTQKAQQDTRRMEQQVATLTKEVNKTKSDAELVKTDLEAKFNQAVDQAAKK